ncbi:MAG TPA: branched-chain amino acid ABC transporter permease [Candidatus Methylomirabilis sp.]|nr:branched-chain amino acid ABC transporter permease [Candidatus Methylomirabilis sp.]HSC71288.1 branched-chain amino acid ABC transporter permease [Candidatus Methylomirabilis sp.]
MMELLSFTMNGLVLGLIFAVVAMGFTLILGVMEVINFAHGILFALGAYFAFSMQRYVGFWLALILAPLLVGLVGLVLERLVIHRTYGGNPLFGLLLTFGLATGLEELIRMIWGKTGYSVAAPRFAAGSLDLGFMIYSKYRLLLAALAILIILLVWLFLEKTPYGAIIRAGASDAEMVMALGKNLPRMRTFVFIIGSMLAGVAGVIAAPVWSVRPTMGGAILMPAMIIVVLGGVGSFWGSVLAGLIVGLSTSISVMFWARVSDIIPFVILMLVLLFRPRGLMGEKSVLEV